MLAQLPTALRDLRLPLRLKLWDGKQIDLGPKPRVTLVVKDPTLVTQLAHPSLDALGAAYVEGRVDLEGPIEEAIEVGDALSTALLGDESAPAQHYLAHDKRSDAEAVSYHYDLSNEFYRLWLDRDMVYSCAYFETGQEDLNQAQQAKLRHLCRKLRLQPGDRLLDVGCGWGGLARFAAREFGVEVYGITLSHAQLELARQRVVEEGLEGRVTLELLDYRDLPQDGRKLVWREAVAKGPAEMRLEFMHSAEARDHPEIEDAALARLESVVTPDGAPAIGREQFLKLPIEIVGVGDRAIDVFIAQYLAAHCHSAVVERLVHGIPLFVGSSRHSSPC